MLNATGWNQAPGIYERVSHWGGSLCTMFILLCCQFELFWSFCDTNLDFLAAICTMSHVHSVTWSQDNAIGLTQRKRTDFFQFRMRVSFESSNLHGWHFSVCHFPWKESSVILLMTLLARNLIWLLPLPSIFYEMLTTSWSDIHSNPQLTLTSVRVSWAGKLEQAECADNIIVKHYKVENFPI